jgi:hypothetical protein
MSHPGFLKQLLPLVLFTPLLSIVHELGIVCWHTTVENDCPADLADNLSPPISLSSLLCKLGLGLDPGSIATIVSYTSATLPYARLLSSQ